MLAVATMTLDHHHWLRAGLVTDISAITTAGDFGGLMGEELIRPYKLACQGLLLVSDEMSQYGKITKPTKTEFDREWTRINAKLRTVARIQWANSLIALIAVATCSASVRRPRTAIRANTCLRIWVLER
jgi:hypothetical protein